MSIMKLRHPWCLMATQIDQTLWMTAQVQFCCLTHCNNSDNKQHALLLFSVADADIAELLEAAPKAPGITHCDKDSSITHDDS